MKLKQRLKATTLLSALALCLPLSAAAQSFPDKPITFVVPFGPGSATDQLARAIGQGVTEITGQTVVIENKPGASAMIGAADVARATPDGYRVLITTNTTHAANQHLFKSLSYDPVKDFEPITLLGKGGQILVVRPDFPAKTVQELIDYAKANPGKLTFGSGSSSSRVAGELFKQMTGTDILHVPYKSNPLVITDVLGGADRPDDGRHGHRSSPGKQWQTESPGCHHGHTLTAGTQCANHCIGRCPWLRNGLLVWRLCAGQHPESHRFTPARYSDQCVKT